MKDSRNVTNFTPLLYRWYHAIIRNLNKKSLQQVGIYTTSGFISKGLSFLALPLFVNLLSEGDIGILSIFSNSIVFFTPIIGLGISYSISIDYFKTSKKEFKSVFSTIVWLPLFISLFVATTLYILLPTLNTYFYYQSVFIWLIPICTLFNIYFELFLLLTRYEKKTFIFAGSSLLKLLIELALAIILIRFYNWNWEGRTTAILISGFVGFGFFLWLIKKIKIYANTFDFKHIKKEFFLTPSSILMQTAIFCLNTSDKFFVMLFFGKEDAGRYSIASTFAIILFVFCSALLNYLQPKVFSIYAQGGTWIDVKPFFKKYLIVLSLCVILVAIFTEFIFHFLLKPSYLQTLPYFFLLLSSFFIWGLTSFFWYYMIYIRNQKDLIIFALSVIAISLFSNYIFIKQFQIIGICASLILVNFIVFFQVWYFNNKRGFNFNWI